MQPVLAAAVASAVYDARQLGVGNPPAALGTEVETFLGANPGLPVQAFGGTDLVDGGPLGAARW